MNRADIRIVEPAAYSAGRAAFVAEIALDDCPHERGLLRQAWMTGWLDSRTINKFSKTFEKYRINWP